jgi:hypothetical protein
MIVIRVEEVPNIHHHQGRGSSSDKISNSLENMLNSCSDVEQAQLHKVFLLFICQAVITLLLSCFAFELTGAGELG